MKAKTTTLVLGLLLAGSSLTVSAQQLAFPGAEGWGRFATGGRTGTVYHVTNLNNDGAGSLRDAVSSPNRIVVFDVSGVINISSRIVFAKNLYVAGQTAPGEGITVYGDGVSFSGANNIIVRYMRFRMGKGGTSGKDAAGIANGTNMIFDHCSFSWGLDETFSINPDGKGDLGNITIQNSIMGQGLLTHSAGGLMQADSITLYRNFYCDNSTRNNKVKGINQYVNNIVYNWNNGCYLMGGDSEGTSYVHITNNLFINGPSGGGNAITSGNADFHVYAVDNWQDKNVNGILDPYEIPRSEYSGGPTFHEQPFDKYPELPAWPASELVDKLLPDVGATLPYRDLVDFYMVHQAKSFGLEGTLLSTETLLPFGVPSSWTLKSFEKPVDSDGDGMPDEWETANGTNPNVNDAMVIASNGYANIENYLNSLTTENREFFLRTPVLLQASGTTDTSVTLFWYDFTEGEEGFAIEQEVDGEYKEIAKTDAGTETYTVSALTAGTAYKFRVRAYKGESYSDYAELEVKTKPEYVEMVDCDTFVGDDDRNWLIAPDTDETIVLTDVVDKDAVVVRTDANVTITGEGSITGNASMNKTGAGELTLDTENSYTGATVLHNGTINFATLKDGGENSAIGASYEYAQNWIWDGGVWNYTGATTSTNRSAQLYKNTELNIANSATTVSFSGSIEGEADFTLGGSGTLKPASAKFFSYNGATVLKGGTLQLDYVDNDADKIITLTDDNSDVSTRLVMAGGNFVTKGANDNYLTYTFPIEVIEDTYSTFTVQRNCTIKSNVSGSGTLEYKIPYVREYVTGDWTEFYGTLVANGVGTEKDGSQLVFLNANYKGMPNTRLYLKGNARIISWNTNDELWLGGLSGDAGTFLSASSKNTTGAQMIWHVGGASTDETFNGVIDNKTSANKDAHTSIVKEGSGDWRLTGANVYNGTTQINGGRLIVNGNNSGAGAYTVNGGATLAGKGTVGGAVTVKSEGTVYAGDTLVDGSTLTLSKTISVAEGATVIVPATSLTCNSIALKGNMTIADGAVLQLGDGGEFDKAPYDATVYQVFKLSGGTISGTFKEVVLPVLGEDQTWDTSALYTEGVIKVVGGEPNPGGDEEPEPEPDPSGETKTALLTWGNMTPGSYDGVNKNNMLTGTVGDLAEGFSLVVTGNLTKNFSSSDKINVEYNGETLNRTTIKLSNGAEESIFLPEGAKVTKMTLWSFTNVTTANRTSYWANVAGVDYTEENSVILQPTKNTANPDKVPFELDDVKDVVTFKNTGEQQCVIIYLEYHYGGDIPSGITAVGGDNTPVRVEYYTVSGERVATPGKGLYIMRATTAAGKTITRKVVF